MGHFAKVENGIVSSVIVADQAFIDSLNETGWVKTSYSTYAGIHSGGGTPLRKNFAGVGYAYDEARDAFIPPCPGEGFSLDDETCQWIELSEPE